MNGRHPLQITALFLSLAAVVVSARADSLDLVNGDHYQGTVVSVTQSNVVFQSEVLGSISLPRNKVTRINLGATTIAVSRPATNSTTPAAGPSLVLQGAQTSGPAATTASTNSSADAVLQQMRQQGIDPSLVNAVQQQVFGQGNPAAAQKFNDIMGGLMAGKLSVADIRAQAQESIQQIKDAKQQLGPDIGDSLDGYLAILQNFVNETATNTTISASPPPASASPASTPP